MATRTAMGFIELMPIGCDMKFVYMFLNWIRHAIKGNPGDWMDTPNMSTDSKQKPISVNHPMFTYQPDEEFEKLSVPVMNPVIAFNEALTCDDTNDLPEGNPFKGKEVAVEEAWIYEGHVNERGALMREKKLLEMRGVLFPFRVRQIDGASYKKLIKESKTFYEKFPTYAKALRENKQRALDALQEMKNNHLVEDIDFAQDATSTPYDSAQYTEYTPLYGGPFNKQLYITDYLTMHARAFEQKNHHPLAKRIIDVLAQYSLGRRFKVRWKDSNKEKVWKDFNAKYNIIHRCSEFWVREYLLYGELMINKMNWQSIDPSTVWDIITDPDDITDVYYYYQTYSTAYQTFVGYRVPGAPGSENQPGVKYIVRQIPSHQVIHVKGNVVSQEKRGRSILFPILGYLKRIKDLYNAEVQRAQLQAVFIWDDTIDGSAGDVQAHISNYSKMPTTATFFAHNKAVERKPLSAVPSGERSGAGIADEILAFIATAVGIPKDFFNIIAPSGGNRATALVGSEPFEKVIEDLQAKFERLLLNIAEEVIEGAGMKYEDGDVEFIFPSVTKDTTSETIKNIGICEELGYFDHEMSAEMAAAEMNITNYDFESVQERRQEYARQNPDPLMPPNSRFSNPGANGKDGVVHGDENPIHGNGKADLKGQLKSL